MLFLDLNIEYLNKCLALVYKIVILFSFLVMKKLIELLDMNDCLYLLSFSFYGINVCYLVYYVMIWDGSLLLC